MRSKYLIPVLLFISIISQAQTGKDEKAAMKFADKVLTTGMHHFSVLDIDASDDYKALLLRFQKAVSENKDWFINYTKEHAKEKSLPYDKRLGLSESEYQQMTKLILDKQKFKVVKKVELEIIKRDGMIQFKGEYPFVFFDKIVFNLNSPKLFIGEQTIPYYMSIDSKTNSSIGEWKGYGWKWEEGSAENAFDQHLNYSLVQISVGKTLDGKILLGTKFIYIEAGQQKVSSDILGFLE